MDLIHNQARSKRIGLLILPIFLIAYLISIWVGRKTGTHLEAISGILLLLFFPGYYLIKSASVLDLGLGKLGRVGLSVFYSFTILSILGYLTQNYFGFNSKVQIWFVFVLNFFLFFLGNTLPHVPILKKSFPLVFDRPKKQDYKINKLDWLLVIAIFCYFLGLIIANPIIKNADNYFYLLLESIRQNHNVSGIRQIFISFPNLTSLFLGIDQKIIFRTIFDLLFIFSTFFLLDYLKQKLKSKAIIAVGYLSILVAPVIAIELNIVRPQVVTLLFTLPILLLCVYSVQKKDILPALISFIFALVAIDYHELSALLLFTSALTISFSFFRMMKEKKLGIKSIIFFMLLVYPYWKLFHFGRFFILVTYTFQTALATWKVAWRWWFLSGYVNIDGAQISWKGIQAVEYYLYNGLVLFIVCLVSYYLIYKKGKRAHPSIFVPLGYSLCFFCFAEILPRLGLFFLPDRALVHLALGLIIILAILLEQVDKHKVANKFYYVIFAVSIGIGIIGTIFVTKNSVTNTFPEELKAANYIKNDLPSNSIILSSQDNNNLVTIYSEKKYFSLMLPANKIDKNGFDQAVNDKLADLSQDKTIIIKPLIIQTADVIENNKTISSSKTIIQQEQTLTQPKYYTDNVPVYFIYSYRKLKNFSPEIKNTDQFNDAKNASVYPSLGYPIIYSDTYVKIFKLR